MLTLNLIFKPKIQNLNESVDDDGDDDDNDDDDDDDEVTHEDIDAYCWSYQISKSSICFEFFSYW